MNAIHYQLPDGEPVCGAQYPRLAPGLAIRAEHYPTILGGPRWFVDHVGSGARISSFSWRRQAEHFLRAIAPLCDWTLPADALRPKGRKGTKFLRKLKACRKEAMTRTCQPDC